MSSACGPVSFMLERRGLYVAVLLFKSLWVGGSGRVFLGVSAWTALVGGWMIRRWESNIYLR